MKYRRPHGSGRPGRPTPDKNGTFGKISLLYKHAIGYAPVCDGEYREVPPVSRVETWTWAIVSLGLAVVGFAFLELKSPMFFTQDDNYHLMGPAYVYLCRTVFSGTLPVWNPFQGGGQPIVDCGGAIAYLPYYLSYGISRFLLGNEFLFVEVAVFFNLLLAVAGGFWAGRKWGLSPALACAFGLSFAFSGFLIVTSRAWMNFSTQSAWIPLIFGCCAPALLRSASWKWAMGTGVVMGCAFHAGFSQLWVYAILFESMIIMSLFVCGAVSFRNMAWNIPAVLLAVAIALPVAWVQMDFGHDSIRVFGSRIFDMGGIGWKALLAALVPPPLISIAHPIFIAKNPNVYGVYYYSGAVFSWGCVFLIAGMVAACWSKRVYARNVLILPALFVLLICLGSGSPVPVDKWMTSLPWFEKFRQPWRHYVFFVLFSSLAGALFFERLSRIARHKRLVQWGVAVAVISLLAASLAFPIPTWRMRPAPAYPPLPSGLEAVVKDPAAKFPQRVVSWGTQKELTTWFQAPDYPEALCAFMPTVYGILSLDRYNTLTWFHTLSRPIFDRFNSDPLNAWRAYGVRWIVCHPEVQRVDAKLFQTWPIPPVRVGRIALLELRDSAPLAFVKGMDHDPLPVSFSAKGAVVQFPSPTPTQEQVVVNIIGWPRFRAYVDRNVVPWTADAWGRVLVSVPANTQKLEVVYEPPWAAGIGAGALVMALALGLSYLLACSGRRLAATSQASCPSESARPMNALRMKGRACWLRWSGPLSRFLPKVLTRSSKLDSEQRPGVPTNPRKGR